MKKMMTMMLAAVGCMTVNAVEAGRIAAVDSLLMPGRFVVRGDMAPGHGDVLSFAVTELLGYSNGYDVKADSAGCFMMDVPLTGPMQEMYLYIDNVITVPVMPDDTVSISIDDTGVRLYGTDRAATLDMELAMRLHREMRPRFIDLNMRFYDAFYRSHSDSARMAFVRDVDGYVNDYLGIVDDFEAEHGRVRCHDYFYESGYFGLLSLFAQNEIADSLSVRYAGEDVCHHRAVGPEHLKYPSVGRALNLYLRGATQRALYGNSYQSVSTSDEIIKQSRYMRSIAADDIIADYVDCNMVFDMLRSGRFWNGGDELRDYFTGIDMQSAFRSAVTDAIARMERSRAGCMSPRLSLAGTDGRAYTLDDFKGKYLLLDFWSPGCGPCRLEFERMHDFKEMFAGYADRINYVTVCVIGEHPSERKTMDWVIEHYNMDDLNTVLDADNSDELYHINVYPTYVLLDPDGRIVNFNTDRPTVVMDKKEHGMKTEFESALSGELQLPNR